MIVDTTQFTKVTVPSWLQELSRELRHGPETMVATCETGDPVVSVAVAGGHLTTLPELWALFVEKFNEYKGSKTGMIYWRNKPTLVIDADTSVTTISARCFIAEALK